MNKRLEATPKTNVHKSKTSAAEKLLYGLGNAGGQCVWTFTGSFLTLYYTDSVLAAAGFVGTMMMLSRFADGVSDIFFGFLIEKTHTKLGKARPWFIASLIPLVASLLMVFNVPDNLSEGATHAYMIVSYLLLTVVFYTIYNLGYWAMLPRISLDPDDRNKVSTVSSICSFLVGLILAVATEPMISSHGGTTVQAAWTFTSVVFGTIGLILCGLCAIFVKEKVPEDEDQHEKVENVPVTRGLKALLKTKYFYMALAIFTLATLTSTALMGAMAYYSRDVLGNSAYYAILALVYVLPVVVGLMFAPGIFKKIGKKRSMILGTAVAAAGSIICLMNPYSLLFVATGMGVSSLGSSMVTCGMWTFAAEIVDYTYAKIGIRVEGLASATNSFGAKVGAGLGSAMLGWALQIGGYDALATQQSQSTVVAEIIALLVIPLIVRIIELVLLTQWNINRDYEEIIAKNNTQSIIP